MPFAIREELNRKHSEAFPESDSFTPSELVHYTSREGFEGIIESGKIWCTDVRHVNDPREGDHGLDVIRSIVLRKSVPESFLEAIRRSQDLFGFKRLWTCYIASFSSPMELPHMWVDYADHEKGFAIAFDCAMLLSAAEEGRRYALFPMLYGRQVQISGTEQIVDHAIQLQRSLNLSCRDIDQFWLEEVAFSPYGLR